MQPDQTLSSTNPVKRVYTALLKQTGTAAPTAQVLQNTLGTTITWTRDSAGYYKATATEGTFKENKTIIRPFGWYGNAVLPISGNISVGYWTMSWNDTTILDLYTIDNMTTFNQVELSAITTHELLIEIEIYS